MIPWTPYRNAESITPSDTADVQFYAIYVGGTGNVRVTTVGGQVTTFVGVPVGTTLHIAVTRVWATGTTATNLVGLT